MKILKIIAKVLLAAALPTLLAWYLLSGEAKRYEEYLNKNTPGKEDISIERSGNAIK